MRNTMKEPFAVDTKAAAELLGVSKSHLEKLRLEDPANSPPFFKVGRCIRYSLEDLKVWVASGG